MSDLVGNPKDRFPGITAQIVSQNNLDAAPKSVIPYGDGRSSFVNGSKFIISL